MNKWQIPVQLVLRSANFNRNVVKHCFTDIVKSTSLNVYLNHQQIQLRSYAKGKDKKKESKGKEKKILINEDEIAEVVDVEKLKSEMNKAVEYLKEDYLRNLSLRSITGSIDSLMINVNGDKVELMELGRIIRSSPGVVIVDLSSAPHAISAASKAITASGMNLNPTQDGSSLIVPIPRVTKEYKESLSKNAKAMFIKCRDRIKDIQIKCIKNLKTNRKEGFSEDFIFSVTDQITQVGNNYITAAEKLLHSKQRELE